MKDRTHAEILAGIAAEVAASHRGLTLHRNVDTSSVCGGQVASGDLFNEDHWCVYCGAKWSDKDRPSARTKDKDPREPR